MFILLVFLNIFSAFAKHDLHHLAEKNYHPDYLKYAHGLLSQRTGVELAPWPVHYLSIGHNMTSYQLYGFNLDEAYFHHGLDIRANKGEKVTASKGGKVLGVTNYVRGNSLYWEVAILDKDGFIWQYHHIDHSSIPQAIVDAAVSGKLIEDGTLIGEVVEWPVTTYGERYHHTHVNVLDGNKNYVNPFHFLVPLPDNSAPKVVDVGLWTKNKVSYGPIISSPYTVFAQVSDLILHDKFIVPPYKISYKLNKGEEKIVWQFDNLPGGDSNEKFVNQFFIPDLTCGNYSCRKLTIDLGFNKEGKAIFPLAKGQYEIEVLISDFAGNKDSKTFTWRID